MQKNWNLDEIKQGFQRFIKENNRAPKSDELSKYDYLPTARTIQRRFGGMENFRKELGLDILHFGKGEIRSQVARSIQVRSRDSENQLKKLLVAHFGEVFVHIERPVTDYTKHRFDFYVYTPSGNFAVDVFYPQDLKTMIRNLNHKEISYSEYNDKLFLVVTNVSIKQSDIDLMVSHKKNRLKGNIELKAVNEFVGIFRRMGRHDVI